MQTNQLLPLSHPIGSGSEVLMLQTHVAGAWCFLWVLVLKAGVPKISVGFLIFSLQSLPEMGGIPSPSFSGGQMGQTQSHLRHCVWDGEHQQQKEIFLPWLCVISGLLMTLSQPHTTECHPVAIWWMLIDHPYFAGIHWPLSCTLSPKSQLHSQTGLLRLKQPRTSFAPGACPGMA